MDCPFKNLCRQEYICAKFSLKNCFIYKNICPSKKKKIFQRKWVVLITADKKPVLSIRKRTSPEFHSSIKFQHAQLNDLIALNKLHMMFHQCRITGRSMCTRPYWVNSVVKREAIWERGWVSSPLRLIDFCISLNWLKDMMNRQPMRKTHGTGWCHQGGCGTWD